MTRTGRVTCVVHGAAFVWLAYCAVQQARYGSGWAVWLFALAAITQVAAVLRESDRSDRARVRVLRPVEAALPTEDAEQLDEAVLGLANACCDQWWTSMGGAHNCSGGGGS